MYGLKAIPFNIEGVGWKFIKMSRVGGGGVQKKFNVEDSGRVCKKWMLGASYWEISVENFQKFIDEGERGHQKLIVGGGGGWKNPLTHHPHVILNGMALMSGDSNR